MNFSKFFFILKISSNQEHNWLETDIYFFAFMI